MINCCYVNLIKCKNKDFQKKADVSFSSIILGKTRQEKMQESKLNLRGNT